jgi:hypothetical protein
MDACQLERHPINNEALLAKYGMGTDHLIDFLSKRLFEAEQVAKARMKQGIDKTRQRPKLMSNATPEASPSKPRPKLSEFAAEGEELNWQTPGGSSSQWNDDDDEPAVILSPEQREAAAWAKLSPEERNTKKRYAAQASCHVVRQQLVDVKKGVMLAKSVEDCIPWAKVTRDLKNESDAIVDLLGRFEKPQPAPLFPHETKFQQLKKTTLVALKEVEAVNSAVLNTCSTLITEDRTDAFREFLRRVTVKLNEAVGDPNAPK